MKIIGYIDLASNSPTIRTKTAHKSLLNKRQQRLNEKADKVIKIVEAQALNREIDKLKSKFQSA